jgi:hypothetical protein
MYVTPELYRALYDPKPTEWEIDRFARLAADLAVFVRAMNIVPQYLHRLAPRRDRVWEIRSLEPEPQIRILGLFAAKNVFIATHYELRENLGVFDRPGWRIAKRRAAAEWRKLFPPYDARPETDIHQLVTGAIDGTYFRDRRAH